MLPGSVTGVISRRALLARRVVVSLALADRHEPLGRIGDRVEHGENPVGEVRSDGEPDADDDAEKELCENENRVDEHENADDGERRAGPRSEGLARGERIVSHADGNRRAASKS